MNREIILVEVITKSDMSTEKSKAFTKVEKAENYFAELVKEMFPTVEQDEIDNSLDDGFFDYKLSLPNGDREEKSITIKEITFEED